MQEFPFFPNEASLPNIGERFRPQTGKLFEDKCYGTTQKNYKPSKLEERTSVV